jgi:hypothetical protein
MPKLLHKRQLEAARQALLVVMKISFKAISGEIQITVMEVYSRTLWLVQLEPLSFLCKFSMRTFLSRPVLTGVTQEMARQDKIPLLRHNK